MNVACPACRSEFKTKNDFGAVESCPKCRHIFDAASVRVATIQAPRPMIASQIPEPPPIIHPQRMSQAVNPPLIIQQVQPMPVYYVALASPPKSRLAYVLLGLFLGGLGIHNFYSGHTADGVTKLVMSLFGPLTCFVLNLVVAIWAIVDICIVTGDANNVPFN